MTKKLLMGNEAIAHAALEAGVGVVAGYPGTPSSEIVETVARLRANGAAHGVHVEWSTNEKAALELLFGASLAGKRGLFTCKQMGLNVASDALMSLNYVSVRAGLVLVVADDPGPISSQTEQDTRRFASFAKVPVLDPSTPEQAFEMVKAAFELSERFNTPVIVRPTTRIDHASTFIDVADETAALPLLNEYGYRPVVQGGSGEGDASVFDLADSPTQALVTDGSDLAEEERKRTTPGGFLHDPDKWVIFPKRAYEAHGEINDRLREMADVFTTEEPYLQFNEMKDLQAIEPDSLSRVKGRERTMVPAVYSEAPTYGILAGGVSAAYVQEALHILQERIRAAGLHAPACRFMQVGTPYPFPEARIAEFSKGLSDVLVIEELDHVLEDQLAQFVGRTRAPFNVHGKLTGEMRDRGENDVDDIVARLERFLGLTGRLSLHRARTEVSKARVATAAHAADTGEQPAISVESAALEEARRVRLGAADEAQLPARPPVLCAGCPHRGSFHAVKMALGKTPAVLCGDIGCYTLGNAAPLDAVDTCLCMGAGITMAQGIAVADPDKKAIAYIGDSTFFASGMTGLVNAAYNGHDITVLVLDNSTTAMTGAQPHPGTGETLMGERNEPIDIEAVLNASGFKRVFTADAFDRDASIVAVRAALAYEGPSAVLFEGSCAQLVPPGDPVEVNPDACTGCKRCITSLGCPAIGFNASLTGMRSRDRGQAFIDAELCVGCGLCVQVCPAKAIERPFDQLDAELADTDNAGEAATESEFGSSDWNVPHMETAKEELVEEPEEETGHAPSLSARFASVFSRISSKGKDARAADEDEEQTDEEEVEEDPIDNQEEPVLDEMTGEEPVADFEQQNEEDNDD